MLSFLKGGRLQKSTRKMVSEGLGQVDEEIRSLTSTGSKADSSGSCTQQRGNSFCPSSNSATTLRGLQTESTKKHPTSDPLSKAGNLHLDAARRRKNILKTPALLPLGAKLPCVPLNEAKQMACSIGPQKPKTGSRSSSWLPLQPPPSVGFF